MAGSGVWAAVWRRRIRQRSRPTNLDKVATVRRQDSRRGGQDPMVCACAHVRACVTNSLRCSRRGEAERVGAKFHNAFAVVDQPTQHRSGNQAHNARRSWVQELFEGNIQNSLRGLMHCARSCHVQMLGAATHPPTPTHPPTHTHTHTHTGMRDAVGARAPLPLLACCVSSQPSS